MIQNSKYRLYPLVGAGLEPSRAQELVGRPRFVDRFRSAMQHFQRRFAFSPAAPKAHGDSAPQRPSFVQHPLQAIGESALSGGSTPQFLAGLIAAKSAGGDPAAYRELLTSVAQSMNFGPSAAPAAPAPSQAPTRRRGGLTPPKLNR